MGDTDALAAGLVASRRPEYKCRLHLSAAEAYHGERASFAAPEIRAHGPPPPPRPLRFIIINLPHMRGRVEANANPAD